VRVPYAGAQNYGWPRMNIKPQKFMQRADEEMQPTAPTMLQDGIDKLIRDKGLG
jgi:hypothetical protein